MFELLVYFHSPAFTFQYSVAFFSQCEMWRHNKIEIIELLLHWEGWYSTRERNGCWIEESFLQKVKSSPTHNNIDFIAFFYLLICSKYYLNICTWCNRVKLRGGCVHAWVLEEEEWQSIYTKNTVIKTLGLFWEK